MSQRPPHRLTAPPVRLLAHDSAAADHALMGTYERYPRWIRIGVWFLLLALVAMVLTSVFLGF